MASRELTDEQLKLLDVFEYNGLTLGWFTELVLRAKNHLIENETPAVNARGPGGLRSHWRTVDIGMLARVEHSLAQDRLEVER